MPHRGLVSRLGMLWVVCRPCRDWASRAHPPRRRATRDSQHAAQHWQCCAAAHAMRRGIPCAQVPGVIILSEFAGAAQSLGAGALLINPWNITVGLTQLRVRGLRGRGLRGRGLSGRGLIGILLSGRGSAHSQRRPTRRSYSDRFVCARTLRTAQRADSAPDAHDYCAVNRFWRSAALPVALRNHASHRERLRQTRRSWQRRWTRRC